MRPITVDLDTPDAESLERLWDEIRARHAARESDDLHLKHQARTRELLDRTSDRPALGSFRREQPVPLSWHDYLDEQLKGDTDWMLTCLIGASVELGFPVAEVIDIALATARAHDIPDAVSAPVISQLLVRAK
jgi:hypothetical protein